MGGRSTNHFFYPFSASFRPFFRSVFCSLFIHTFYRFFHQIFGHFSTLIFRPFSVAFSICFSSILCTAHFLLILRPFSRPVNRSIFWPISDPFFTCCFAFFVTLFFHFFFDLFFLTIFWSLIRPIFHSFLPSMTTLIFWPLLQPPFASFFVSLFLSLFLPISSTDFYLLSRLFFGLSMLASPKVFKVEYFCCWKFYTFFFYGSKPIVHFDNIDLRHNSGSLYYPLRQMYVLIRLVYIYENTISFVLLLIQYFISFRYH